MKSNRIEASTAILQTSEKVQAKLHFFLSAQTTALTGCSPIGLDRAVSVHGQEKTTHSAKVEVIWTAEDVLTKVR
jgi:hypothetical protein